MYIMVANFVYLIRNKGGRLEATSKILTFYIQLI